MIHIPNNSFIIIDGTFYLYRAYYALPNLRNKQGKPTGAIYGMINMLLNLIKQYKPTYLVVVFDTQRKTFRNKIFKNYKSHRSAMPNNLYVQIEPLCSIIEAMGISVIMANDDVEADDFIGSIARQAEKINLQVLIVADDKDMTQLVTSNVKLINISKNTILGPKEVENKYGIPPKLIIDFFALIGDCSDNIPGVPGIGKKTASILLQNVGGLNILYNKLEKISNLKFRGAKSIAKKLEKHKELADLSYRLVTIKTDISLNLNYDQLRIKRPIVEKLIKLFEEYEFRKWINDIKLGQWLYANKKKSIPQLKKNDNILNLQNEQQSKTSIIPLKKRYDLILDNEEKFINLIRKLKETSIFAFNTIIETSDNVNAHIVGFSFSINPGNAVYVPVSHNYHNAPNQLTCAQVLNLLKPILESKKILKVGNNFKSSCSIYRKYDIQLHGIAFDIMLESYVLDNTVKKHDINSLYTRWLEYEIHSPKDIMKEEKKYLTFSKVTLEEAYHYAAKDIDITLQLHLKMWPQLRKQKSSLRIFRNIEMPLIMVLSRVEWNGVKIDSEVLYKYSKEIDLRLSYLKKKTYEMTNTSFNFFSSKEIQTVLLKHYGIKLSRKTSSGLLSTSEKILEELAINYSLPKIILEYRKLAKLKSNYIDKLPLMINPKTGRVHTSYHQTVTTTGRLSSTNPNLQNIPIKNEEGRRIRQAFIAPEDFLLVSADYSQIELRIIAHLSGDKKLLKAFSEGKDIHLETAAEIFKLPLKAVNENQRRNAKAINFGLIYGMSVFGLSKKLNISYKESKEYINRYFEHYKGVSEYIKSTLIQAKTKGFVETLYGRRLYLPNITFKDTAFRAGVERGAINAPMQGTAADIIKCAMISVDTWIKKEKPRVRMIMQVHDELVFEVHKEDVKEAEQQIRNLMENSSITLSIPLLVKIRKGKNWNQLY